MLFTLEKWLLYLLDIYCLRDTPPGMGNLMISLFGRSTPHAREQVLIDFIFLVLKGLFLTSLTKEETLPKIASIISDGFDSGDYVWNRIYDSGLGPYVNSINAAGGKMSVGDN